MVDGTKFRKKIISKQVIKLSSIKTFNHSTRRNFQQSCRFFETADKLREI